MIWRFHCIRGRASFLVKTTAMENQKLKEIIAQVEKEMNGDGRVLVRPSGTEPLLRIMAEAATPELVHEYVERIGDVARAEIRVAGR